MTPEALIAQAKELVQPYLIDTCDLTLVTSTKGSSGGQTVAESVIASDLPCLLEPLSANRANHPASLLGDSPTQAATHKIFLLPDSDTQSITPEHRITIHARDDRPELILTGPKRADESFEVLVTLVGRITL